MEVTLRKVGNSFVVTVPLTVVERLDAHEGDKLTLKNMNNGFYYEQKEKSTKINWDKYTNFNDSKRALDPVGYIREMRDNDRM